jgi:hypothetical protein
LSWPRRVWLFDQNTKHFSVSDLDVFNGDLRTLSIPSLCADLAVVDPPWYPEHQLAFLWAASCAVRPGGTVFASAPRAGSRPSAAEEWRVLVEAARSLQLVLERVERSALPYVIPPFEANSLFAAGSPRVPADWRRGDLAIFRRTAVTSLAPRPSPGFTRESWTDHEVSDVRFKVREDSRSEFSEPRLKRLLDGDIMPSVSRRHPLRRHVSVWTSGNRVYGSDAPNLVATTLEELARDLEVGMLARVVVRRDLRQAELAAIADLRIHLTEIVETERVEYVSRRE